jgi:hypothetical protein
VASVLLTQIRRAARQGDTLKRMLTETRELARLLTEAADKPDPSPDQADELQRLAVRIDRLEKSIREAGG